MNSCGFICAEPPPYTLYLPHHPVAGEMENEDSSQHPYKLRLGRNELGKSMGLEDHYDRCTL